MFNNSMFGESAKYTVNTVIAQDKTANSNLDGTGALSTLITATTGGPNGTFVNSITIKTTTRTLQGMIRVFVYDGTNTRLLHEIEVDPHAAGAVTWPTYLYKFNIGFALKSGYVLKVGVENADTFNCITEAFDWIYG